MTVRSVGKHRKRRPASRVRVGSRLRAGLFVPAVAVVTAATVTGGVSTAVAADNPNQTVITVGGDPQGVAVDPDGKHAYVASYADNALRVIDTANQRVVSIHVGANPCEVEVDPDSRHAFVANYSENSVSVIDTAHETVIRKVDVGAGPTGMAIFPRDHYAFVTNYYGNSVSVINIANLTLIGTVPVGTHPDGVAIDPRGEFAYVTNSGSNSVSVIDVHTQKVARTVMVGRSPQKVAIDPDGRHAYVTNSDDNNVSVIDLPTQLGVDFYKALLKVNNTIPVGIHPRGLAVNRNSHRAYVVNVGDETMSVIDTATGTVIGSSYVGGDPDGVAVAPDGTAYVTSREDGTVTVIPRSDYPDAPRTTRHDDKDLLPLRR
ncbi:MAG: beta-propeller fold lactonase family protein [Pseudonocardiaceae bacterium]